MTNMGQLTVVVCEDMVSRSDLVVVGEVGVDAILLGVSKIPKNWSDVEFVEGGGLFPAGSAGYVAQCFSKLGGSCRLVGKIGDDDLGSYLLRQFKKYGVDVNFLKITSDEETEMTVILIFKDLEKIQFITKIAPLTSEDVDASCLDGARALHFAGYLLMPELWGDAGERLARRAKADGLFVSLNTQMCPREDWASPLKKILKHVDLLLVDEEEAKRISGAQLINAASKALRELGPEIVAIKMGKEGCFVLSKEGQIKVPAVRVSSICTVGAGDAFDSAFILGALNRWEIGKTARFANSVAALSTTKLGCSTALSSAGAMVKNLS